MAGGSYSQRPIPEPPAQLSIPPRATRQLQRDGEEQERDEDEKVAHAPTINTEFPTINRGTTVRRDTDIVPRGNSERNVARYNLFDFHIPRRHRSWLQLLTICIIGVVLAAFVLISASIFQRPGSQQFVPFPGGQVYSIQVGGSVDNVDTWTNTTAPIPPRVPIHTGPYSVLGKPTITVAFINDVLASYHSPAAGKGQALYDLGVKYGIDPAFALAFFLHESTMGTTGVARTTLSLGNLRCIPTRPCIDQNIGGFAQMYNWEDGFEQFYKLIRNLYVAKWGLVTVDQIIPIYAPDYDHNDSHAYIAALKHAIDTWHAGIIQP